MHPQLDTAYDVETPEAIDLCAQLAGPLPRILAYLTDFCIRGVVLIVAMTILAFLGKAGWGVFLIISFALEWFYPVFFEVLRRGQTPGKKILQIAVVNDDLTPVTWNASLIRNLLRAADVLPFGYLLGVVSVTCSQYFQRLGDFAAGTVVIYRKKAPHSVALPKVPPVAPAAGLLSFDDQLMIASFTRRHDQISPARQQELAEILAPLTHKQGEDAVAYLHSIGVWLLGKEP